jgi:hypothetical protein
MFYFLYFVCVLQSLVLHIVFGDYSFDCLVVTSHQTLWVLYMSIVFFSLIYLS